MYSTAWYEFHMVILSCNIRVWYSFPFRYVRKSLTIDYMKCPTFHTNKVHHPGVSSALFHFGIFHRMHKCTIWDTLYVFLLLTARQKWWILLAYLYMITCQKTFKNARKQFHTLPYICILFIWRFSPIAYELNVICKWRLWACLNRVSRCVVNPSTVGRNCLYSYQFLLLHPDLLFCARLYKCKCPSAFWISRDRIDLTRVVFACGPIILARLQWE